jgi:hypothetical protein
VPRAAYRGIVGTLQELGAVELRAREEARDEWVAAQGLTYARDG